LRGSSTKAQVPLVHPAKERNSENSVVFFFLQHDQYLPRRG
jgi:hypothetical protein